ncbi:GAF domain-containing protein [Paenibacillus sp. NEAU-GSW1]|uniref:GAF domain-containing protein n=1 Tax=Paenibacillus sp. NEAU-GSW1 TaxID=2682486 RepID=UPI0012E29BA7|nr:GAF domain-containing protein [Paenibacillus sp. NEAU-GSW1]MUT67835.1 GAF domain-containing protein [Paenibacillus sp. NEAU-GSW1]
MFANESYSGSKEENYGMLLKQLTALIEDEPSRIANLANASALLGVFLERINWVGFYMLEGEDTLVLGPFQGKPACTRIAVGKGVCGTAVSRGEAVLVDDVHQFPGHIACDSASNSELVIPLRRDGRIIGVLDIDSPEFARFDETDARCLTEFADVLGKYV